MDHDAALRSPTARMGDEDTTLGDATGNTSLFNKTDDSLFGHVLRADAGIRSEAPVEDTESAEQVQRQLEQLQHLNRVFSSYESALAGGVEQIEVCARTTDADLCAQDSRDGPAPRHVY